MAATDDTATGWRARWARRENERRRTAYEAAVETWRRRDDELRRICARAEDPQEPLETPAGLPVTLDPDEVVATVQPVAELVEVAARHTAGLPAPELTVVPVEDRGGSSRLPKGVTVVDAGMAVVTDRRLILVGGRGTREWPYPRLTGVAHDPDEPFTLLHMDDRGRIGGVRVPAGAAADFRLRLTMAYADAAGGRDALLDRLDEAVVTHWRTRPATPGPATPADAPAAARLARPALVAAVAVLVALAAVAGTVRWSAADRPVVGMGLDGGPGAAPTGPVEPTASTAIGAPAGSVAPPTGTGPTDAAASGRPQPGTAPAAPAAAATTGTSSPPRGGPPTTSSVRPTPDRTGARPSPTSGSPSPTPTGRCGAPENPYGYNYCGGSYVDDPAADVCSYFDCVATFWDGNGYVVQCNDGLVSMTGVPRGPCADHGGTRRPLYG
ncbi:hypothetical protein GCM10023176_27920 [Micromonospora coerulea]|uniref:Uncharacterized protein n=1 Tax=Micromonospora coerulea TaxID=47856 RepID=A0ABP8SIT1_9ACTN